MGPTLWTNDGSIYNGGHATHYDMLHDSPNGAGIAWESGTAYWIFDGWHQSLTRYNFRNDELKEAPLGIVLTMAGKAPEDRVPPAFLYRYGW